MKDRELYFFRYLARRDRKAGAVPDTESSKEQGMKETGYEVIIWWSTEKQRFLAEVPELHGCTAEGASLQEAAKAAEDMIEAWITESLKLGREIPRPRGRLLYA